MRLPITIALLLGVAPIFGADKKETLLKESVETIRLIWTEWMHKPKLDYERIDPKQLSAYFGDWHGSYLREEEKEEATLTINKDGSWSSHQWELGGEARWYLAEGMILLFEKPVDDPETDLATAVILKKGVLHLINNQAKDGLIRLERKQEAEQVGAGQPATAPESKPEGKKKTKPESEVRSQ